MTHGKKSKTIYTDLKYNRYMTDDRNRKSGNPVSKICNHDNCNKTAIYNHWGMKPRFCFDHKDEYHVDIPENPVSKIYNHDNCNKTAIYNHWGMKPRFCFDHKDEYHVDIPKKHILCFTHYISHSLKTKCPKCKIKKSPKCDECNITASYNFPELKPLKCLKHRETGMVNIKRKHVLCEKHDISHSKKSGCKICKLDIDNYYESSKYMQDKIFENFHYNLTEKIKKKFQNHSHKEMYDNILNNSKNKNIIKFERIYEERQRISYIMGFYIGNKYQYYGINKNKINDLNKKIKKLNTLKREIFREFDKSNYKNINEYIEYNKNDKDVLNYIIIKKNPIY